jgi:hypothetical protein
MKKTIPVKQKVMGRPHSGITPLMCFRADPVIRASIVKWAEKQPDRPTLSEAIRRLVELGLKGQDASEASQQARPKVARSGARHKDDRKDYRPFGTAGRTSAAAATPNQGAVRIPRGPRRSAEGEEMSPMVGNPPWAPEEDERLRALALSGASIAEMAKQMKRSAEAVRSRAYRLKIVVAKSRNKGWRLKAKGK